MTKKLSDLKLREKNPHWKRVTENGKTIVTVEEGKHPIINKVKLFPPAAALG